MSKYLNEECVKNNIIIPFFKRMGFENVNIEFETHFKIMIPRQGCIDIGETITKDVYSDIVYKMDIKGILTNVFLVEVKRGGHVLTENDIKQAISYARLMEQIPFFSIVTNGSVTRVFDSITMKEVFENDDVSSCFGGLSLSIDNEIRIEALNMLVGLNSKNLIKICDLISIRNLNEIRSTNISNKTIIEAVHCSRKKYIEDFKNYLKSKRKVYGVIGKSGYGKTNHIYSIWEKYHDQFPCVFINLGRLSKSITETLAEEFRFMINRDYSVNELVNQLNNSLNSNRLFLILDGIDEYLNFDNINNEINELVKYTKDTNIHLIVSCKITELNGDQWKMITTYKGSPSLVGENIYSSSMALSFGYCGTYIDKMDDEELEQLWRLYKHTFKIKGKLRGEAKALGSEPYVLKMIAEVFENKSVDCSMTEIEIYRKWVELKVSQLSNPEMGSYVFGRIVKYLVDNNMANVDLNKVIEMITERLDGYPILFELVKLGLLDVQTDQFKNKMISVCNDSIRDYIFCFKIEKWYRLSLDEMIKKFDECLQSEYLRPILIYYISMLQNSFENMDDIWSAIYSESGKVNCVVCSNDITQDDEITIVLEIINKEFKTAQNLGAFKIAHKGCAYNGPSIFSLNPEDKTAILNFTDFLALEKLKRLFRNLTERQIRNMSTNAEKNKAKRHKYYKVLPTENTIGQPFWSIMEFVDDVNTGNIHSEKCGGEVVPILFISKADAVIYLLSNAHNTNNGMFCKRVVGIDRNYFIELEKLYSQRGRRLPQMAISMGRNEAELYEFSAILEIVNSGLGVPE